jgi:DEAD/DEAH box helicase domain-containing protein
LTGAFHADLFELVFEAAAETGVVTQLEIDGQPAEVYALAREHVFADVNVATMACTECGRHHRVPTVAASTWDGIPCTKPGCEGLYHSDGKRQNSYLDRLFSHPRNRRVVAREHTSLLEADDRRRLETRFIQGTNDWDPNTLSATPTLEMGIDIGDLSSLLLCSVPPEQANYIQRIGRTGRRDGNSLNMTIVNGRPHDLQFWAEPEAMISGAVQPPGVYLEAIAVLKRQIAAASLDRWVAGLGPSADFGTVKGALDSMAIADRVCFGME